MPRIFISYRRTDSKAITSRIYDRLATKFGKSDIFKDVDNIPPGRDFRGIVREATTQCRVMLVVIGPNWVNATDANGNRRLDNPNDFVRIEVETGLERDEILVIPLLVEGASMPIPTQLPDTLRQLTYNNAFTLHDDPLFHHDMDTLIKNLPLTPRRKWSFLRWFVGGVAFLLIVLSVMYLQLRPNQQTPTQAVSFQATDRPTDSNTQVAIVKSPEPSEILQPTQTPSTIPEPSAMLQSTVIPTQGIDFDEQTRIAATEAALSGATMTPANSPGSLGFSGNPVASNGQWKPYIDQYARQFEDVDMVLVPVGCFMMGDPSDAFIGDGGKQCFNEPFWIDRYEVTNKQFAQFGGQAAKASYFTDTNQPRDSVTWFEARDFCEQKRGGYLPTEAEWEYAARGPDDLIYPWGNDWNADNAVSNSSQAGDVGSKLSGVSWIGAYDLSGNVWEWVNTIFDGFAYPYATDDGRESNNNTNSARIFRGGSWGESDSSSFRAAFRRWDAPDVVGYTVGFRCARSYNPGDLNS